MKSAFYKVAQATYNIICPHCWCFVGVTLYGDEVLPEFYQCLECKRRMKLTKESETVFEKEQV